MYSSLIAVVLCILAQTASAQCVNTTDTARPASVTAPQAATSRSGGELITTAAASTREAPPVARATPTRRSHDEDKDGSGSTGMLLAALALMSGIALRRYSANGQ